MSIIHISFRIHLFLYLMLLPGSLKAVNIDIRPSLTDTVPHNEDPKTEDFFDSLRIKADKNRITRELHNIVVKKRKKSEADTIETQLSYLKYEQYEGLKIRDINFVRLNPFGTSINDTSYVNDSPLNKIANTLHIKTLKNVLKSNLLIKTGELIEPEIIADNERVLRDLPYINDVRVIISPDASDPGYADITFITRDVWPKAVFPELKDLSTGKLVIQDRNILGSGIEFQSSVHWDPAKTSMWGYEAALRNKNIMGSFIDAKTYYKSVFETESYGIQLNRKFFTPNTKYAGGLNIYKMNTVKRIWLSDSLQPLRSLDYNYSDFWLGRSFNLKTFSKYRFNRLNLILASRLLKERYFERPMEVDERLLYDYHNKTLWLNSISISVQSYYRSNLIYGYGHTEDIPTGWLGNISLGKEFSEFNDRLYSSLSLSYGDFLGAVGYANLHTSVGGFINDKKAFEQGVFKLDLDYFTKLFLIERFKMRFFGYMNYAKGLNRFPLERINLNNDAGIRGLSDNTIYGKQKVTINFEAVVFSPYKLYGFNLVFYGFSDHGFIGEEDISLGRLERFNGFGLGIRIRNERLVFPTIQLRFSFYPGIKDLSLWDHINFSGEKKLNPGNFAPGAPALIIYH